MDTMLAFAKGQQNRHKELMVFDWDKCARLIVERKPEVVSAGLQGDWEYTGGVIWKEGKMVEGDDTYVYLASTWAIPEIDIDGDVMPCFKMQSQTDGWDSQTYYPYSAIKILESAEVVCKP